MEKFKLSRPILDGDTKIEEIEYDLDALGFNDLAQIKQQFIRVVGAEAAAQTMVKAMDETYQLIVMSKASGIPFEVLRGASLKDAVRLGLRVQSFLLITASTGETTE